MKVLNINKFYYIKGGSDSYYFGLKELFEKNGIRVIPFSMKDSKNFSTEYDEYFVDNIDYFRDDFFKKVSLAFKILYSFEAKRKISKLLDAEKPDIAHLHIFQHQLSPSILPQIKRRGIPIVYTVHDLKPICPNYQMLCQGKICEKCKGGKYYHCLFNRCTKDSFLGSVVNTVEMYFHRFMKYYDLIDLFITPSNFYREKMIEFGFSGEKIFHLPNFVKADNYHPSFESENYFVYLGRLSLEKGIITLVEAMKDVQGASLQIIGDGPVRLEIQNTIKNNRLKNVKLLGYKAGPELKKILTKCMFTVMPSEWYENGPMSLLESFALGKPVVGARIGGIPELIEDGVDGLLFESGNAEDLAAKIQYLIDHKDMLSDMGRKARNKIEVKYSSVTHYEKINKIYSKVMV